MIVTSITIIKINFVLKYASGICIHIVQETEILNRLLYLSYSNAT